MPLKELTTFKVGGAAKFFTTVEKGKEAAIALEFAREQNIPVFILGEGSNILISDSGFPGLVISNNIKGIKSNLEKGRMAVTVGSGENWDNFVEYCIKKNWAGIECLSGIPGKVGSAPVQNINAYGQAVSTTVSKIWAIRCKTIKPVLFTNIDCNFKYRKSIFNTIEKGNYIITSVTFSLIPNGRPTIAYHDIKKYFEYFKRIPTLKEVRQAVINIRYRKGAMILPNRENYKSAGSFFKNSVVSEKLFQEIQQTVSEEKLKSGGKYCRDPWFWRLDVDSVKIASSCLINCAGFVPGCRKDKVGISPKHTLFIINYGNAKTGDIITFAKEIQNKVKEKFGVDLEIEPELVGIF